MPKHLAWDYGVLTLSILSEGQKTVKTMCGKRIPTLEQATPEDRLLAAILDNNDICADCLKAQENWLID